MIDPIQIKIKYHDEKYGEVKRLTKLDVGNWIDVYAAKSVTVHGINSVIEQKKLLIEEIHFFEKIEFSGVPLCPDNGKMFLQNMKEHLLDQMKELEKPTLIPLGFSLELPAGYEGYLLPRSSSFKSFNFIQTNSMGVVDEAYKGANDEWFYPVIGVHQDTIINKGDKIAQFRIQKVMPTLAFVEVTTLDNADRGGHGSTGKN